MFNTQHIIYIVASIVLTVGFLVGGWKIKDKTLMGISLRNAFLKFFALSTFILHISIIWVDFFSQQGFAEARDNIILPIYFCNLCMYSLIVVAFMRNKEGKAFRWLASFVAWGGIFGSVITLFGSDYLANDPNMEKYETVKSMLSHSTMLVGCLYLFVGKYISFRVANVVPFVAGLLGCGVVGFVINTLYAVFNIPSLNSMYLQGSIIAEVPMLVGWVLALLTTLIVFASTAVFELIALKPEDRFYTKLFSYIFKHS